ncbi:MAG: hypothetical protein HUU37_03335 [Bdellovibrionales bacterium]|nr:hypothetical protein [Bdellovibrionales bacterium]
MKKLFVMVFSLLALVGAVGAPSAASGPLPARLFYLFSADDASLRLGAAHLDRWNQDHGRPLQVLGVVQHRSGTEALEQLRFEEGISFPLVGAAAQPPDLPAELSRQLDNPAGFVLLLDGTGRAAAAGSAAELNQVLARAALLLGAQVSTEVDESTWGKVKEIFK